MSRATRNRPFILQYQKTVRSESGAKKLTWTDLKVVYVSTCETNEATIYQSAKYKESTHIGITNTKGIKSDINRLVDDNGVIYEILSAVGDGRMTNLLLKKVET